mmetsp:Transcript_35914/g.32310  ORF Transcript_35914/g.32310 Transcript_35914/m.32310 type:complete len:132 (-) Transcript_35914:419-814(-)
MDCDQTCKFLLIGKEATGKTSIMNRYMDSKFTDRYITTVGISQKSQELMIDKSHSLCVQVWDTAGKNKLRKISNSYMSGINVFLVVFDITNQVSFEDALGHIAQIEEKRPEAGIILIGNKSDKAEERTVSQ